MVRRVLHSLWILPVLLGFACASKSPATRKLSPNNVPTPIMNAPGGQNGNLQSQRNFEYANRQFRVFDPSFDFNPTDSMTASQLAQRFPVRTGGSSEVAWVGRGPDFFAARMAMLDRARKSVRIQSLIFENDESSRTIANKLIDLVNRGIEVKIIIDPVINYSPDDQELYFQLQRNGVMIEGYEALYLQWVGPTLEMNDLGLTVGDANMRYHEKMFIVDGELPTGMALIGGVNLGNNYFRADTENYEEMWRDRDALVRGTVVSDMVRTFETTYQEFYQKRASGLFGDTSKYWNWTNLLLGKKGKIEMDGMDPKILQTLSSFRQIPFNPKFVPVDIRFIQSRPRFKEDLIMPAFIDMISRAKSEILINNSYFLPDSDFKAAVMAAIQRGVKVKIITNHMENTDFSQLHLLARTEYKNFLQFNGTSAGGDVAEIYEWAGEPVLGNGEGLNHSKYAIFDRKAVMVGSFNIDPRSRKLNSEGVVFFESPEAASFYVTEFMEEISPKYSQKVSFFQSQSFDAPGGLKEQFELKMADILREFL